MKRFQTFLINRPFAFILILASIRTFIYGSLIALGTPDAKVTIMWQYLLDLGISNVVFGVVLAVVSALSVFFVVRMETVIANRLLYFQALLWFGIGIIYLVQANYILSLVMGFAWFVLISFSNFHYKWWVERKEAEDAEIAGHRLSQGQARE